MKHYIDRVPVDALVGLDCIILLLVDKKSSGVYTGGWKHRHWNWIDACVSIASLLPQRQYSWVTAWHYWLALSMDSSLDKPFSWWWRWWDSKLRVVNRGFSACLLIGTGLKRENNGFMLQPTKPRVLIWVNPGGQVSAERPERRLLFRVMHRIMRRTWKVQEKQLCIVSYFP